MPSLLRTLAMAVLLCGPLLAVDEAEVRTLIAKLSDDDSSVRDGAQARLEELGSSDDSGLVERVLLEGERASDPEVAARCRAILSAVRYWDRLLVFWSGDVNGAFDVQTGQIAWTRDEEGSDTRALWMSAAARRPGIFEMDYKRGLSRLDPWTGKPLWTASDFWDPGIAIGDRWIGNGSEGTTCISLEDGRRLWSSSLSGSFDEHDAAPIDSGKAVAFGTSLTVTALDVGTGETLWRNEGGPFEWLGEIRGGLFAVNWPNGDPKPRRFEVVRIDPKTGRELWRRDMSPEICFPVLYDGGAANDLVILSTEEIGCREGQRTVALDATSGEVRWSLSAKTQDILLDADGGHAVIASDERVARIDLSGGKVIVEQPLPYCWARFLRDGQQVVVLSANPLNRGADVVSYEAGSLRQRWRTTIGEPVEISCLINSSFHCDGRVERRKDRLLVFRRSSCGDFIDILGGAHGELLRHVDLNAR